MAIVVVLGKVNVVLMARPMWRFGLGFDDIVVRATATFSRMSLGHCGLLRSRGIWSRESNAGEWQTYIAFINEMVKAVSGRGRVRGVRDAFVIHFRRIG